MKVSPMPSINENELEDAVEKAASVTSTDGDEAVLPNNNNNDNGDDAGGDDGEDGDGDGGGGEADEGGGSSDGLAAIPDGSGGRDDFENLDSITTVPDEEEEAQAPSEDPKSVDEISESDADGGKMRKTASGKLMKGNSIELTEVEGERNARPSSKIRIFKQRNIKMSSRNLNQVLPIEFPKEFQVIWRNINYKVKAFERTGNWTGKMVDKQILFDLNGHFTSGQVTAIMGPSGAGKSTLLEIIACRRRLGLSGEVKLKDIGNARIAFVPQNNYLMMTLTVLETMTFAARLQNIGRANFDYEARVSKLIKMFGMEPIRDTRVARCSGGQQKRLSICLELFQSPNILILDEPTTGLDSASCSLVMKLLKELVETPETPMAIVCTIHQPAWNLFNDLDHVYIMSKRGRLLYTGTPGNLLPTMNKAGLVCDEFNSPSDFVIEIAAEDYGTEPVAKMIALIEEGLSDEDATEVAELPNLRNNKVNRKVPFFPALNILLQRSGVVYRRTLTVLTLRIVSLIIITIWLQLMFGTEIGKVSGCTMRKLELYATPVDKLSTLFEESILLVAQNSCCLFFGLLVGLISGMTAVVLEFPREMHIFMKEYNNGWYSCIAFFITKSLIDIPMQILMPSIYVLYIYEFTSQPKQYFREAYLLYITVMVGFASESIGAMCSAIFMDNPMAAAVAAGAVPLPMTLFGGFLVKYSRMPIYMQMASWLSLLKYAFEGIMVTMYGLDRCSYNYQEFLATHNQTVAKPLWARYLPMILSFLDGAEDADPGAGATVIGEEEDEDQAVINKIYTITFKAVNKDTAEVDLERSLILSYFEIYSDNVLYTSVVVIFLYYLVLKVMTYFVILAKLNAST